MRKPTLPWFLAGATVFLSLLLFTTSRATIFRPGDSSLHLLNAQRMLQGRVIYRDFFQFTPPGTELVYLGLFRLFGLRVWIPNFMLLLLGLSLTWISFEISLKVVRGRAAFLPGLLFLTCSFYSGLDATHHWYSVLAVMAAATVAIEERTPARMAAVGMLCGLASFFTQTRGLLAVVGFAAFLAWEHQHRRESRGGAWKKYVCLAGSFFATLVATNLYFVCKAGLARFLDSTVTFVVRYYPADSLANTFKTYLLSPPPLRPWYGLPWLLVYLCIHLLVPATYLVFWIRYRREARACPDHPWDRLMLLNITGLFLFMSVAPAPSFFRLCVVSLPALIVLVWLLTFPGRVERVLAKLVWVFAALLVVFEPLKVQRHARTFIYLPSGAAAFLHPEYYERYRWVLGHTRPSDFFFQADWADTYVALELQNPTPVPYVTNTDFTRPEQVQEVIDGLEKQRVRLILWSLYLDAPQGHSIGGSGPLGPLRVYLRTHYRIAKTFANGDQVWERTGSEIRATSQTGERGQARDRRLADRKEKSVDY